jgi:hypothetical protein
LLTRRQRQMCIRDSCTPSVQAIAGGLKSDPVLVHKI